MSSAMSLSCRDALARRQDPMGRRQAEEGGMSPATADLRPIRLAGEMRRPAQSLTMVEELCSTPEGKAAFDREYAELQARIEQRRKRRPLRRCKYLDFHEDDLMGGTQSAYASYKDWIFCSHWKGNVPNLWGFVLR